jgi:hypothetical protein
MYSGKTLGRYQMFFSRVSVALLALVAPVALSADAKNEGPKHHHLHHALFELKETRVELKEAKHDFGGHRESALKATDAAIVQIERALHAGGDPYKALKANPEWYKKFEHHPHIHRSIHELKEARVQLKEAKHDFGGHREKAIKDVDYAIEQLEVALKFARK